jgi:hypothetical protein
MVDGLRLPDNKIEFRQFQPLSTTDAKRERTVYGERNVLQSFRYHHSQKRSYSSIKITASGIKPKRHDVILENIFEY